MTSRMITVPPTGNWILPENAKRTTVNIEVEAYAIPGDDGIAQVNLMIDQTSYTNGTVFEMLKEAF
jgi:hypothetical protein